MPSKNELTFTEPKRKYYGEYVKACREAIAYGDGEWMPFKEKELKYFRFFAPSMFRRLKTGKGLPEGYHATRTYWCMMDGEFVGECQLRSISGGEDAKNIGHIGYSVKPSLRNKGFGQKILAFAVNRLAGEGVYPIFASCRRENTVSLHCLSKAGFRRAGEHTDKNGKTVCELELRYEKDGDGIRPCECSCGAVVFNKTEDGVKYLIVRSISGEYGFPKGHVEGDETEKETALREIREEAGIDASLIDGFYERTSFFLPRKKNVLKRVTYFLASFENQTPVAQQSEITDIKLVDYEQALSMLRHEDSKRLLRHAHVFVAENL